MVNVGMFMRRTNPERIQEALWWEERCVRRQGGYDLEMGNIPVSLRFLPKGVVYKLNKTNGKATVLKSCKVLTEAESGATSLEVSPKHLLKVGDSLAGFTISSISYGSDKDTLTVSSLPEAIKANTVISDLKETDVVLGFGYETLDLLDRESYQSVSPTLSVEEVYEETLPYFINEEIKAAINKYGYARFRIQ